MGFRFGKQNDAKKELSVIKYVIPKVWTVFSLLKSSGAKGKRESENKVQIGNIYVRKSFGF
jgi:hypothetical protein